MEELLYKPANYKTMVWKKELLYFIKLKNLRIEKYKNELKTIHKDIDNINAYYLKKNN